MSELYQQGLLGDMSFMSGVKPKWARKWMSENSGFWIVCTVKNLKFFLKELKFSSPTLEYARMLIAPPPKSPASYPHYFAQLEADGWNLVATSWTVDLECNGGTLGIDYNGHNYIIGDFKINYIPEGAKAMKSKDFYGRLIISDPPGDVASPSENGTITHFNTPAIITMDIAGFLRKQEDLDEVYENATKPERHDSMFKSFFKKSS